MERREREAEGSKAREGMKLETLLHQFLPTPVILCIVYLQYSLRLLKTRATQLKNNRLVALKAPWSLLQRTQR